MAYFLCRFLKKCHVFTHVDSKGQLTRGESCQAFPQCIAY